eukprot:2765783-Amphidinium_carterae.1
MPSGVRGLRLVMLRALIRQPPADDPGAATDASSNPFTSDDAAWGWSPQLHPPLVLGRAAIASLRARDVENHFAFGGMRRPAESIAHWSCTSGKLGHANATGPTEVQLGGPRFDMKALLPRTSATLTSSPLIGTSIDVELLSSWISTARDRDSEVITWLLEGRMWALRFP